MNKTRGDKTSVPLTIFHKCPIIDVFQGPKNSFPDDIYLFKVNNVNTGTMCEICSK